MLDTPIGRLRLAGYVEGTTLLVLLFIGVPIKYGIGDPTVVSVVGPIHGFAVVCYLILAANAVFGGGWKAPEAVRVLVAAAVPFGPFINDGFLARKSAASLEADGGPQA